MTDNEAKKVLVEVIENIEMAINYEPCGKEGFMSRQANNLQDVLNHLND